MGPRPFDLSLYLVTDPRLAGGRAMEEIVGRAIVGGVTAVQFRDKRACTREMIEQSLRLRETTRAAGVALIINDRLDVALSVEADGLHVGQDDMPAAAARSLLGADRILGVTAANEAEARRAEREGADYVGCNAVFATPTKADTGEPLGLEGLTRLVQAVRVPVVAIGGVNEGNAAQVLRTGVAGIAVVSAIVAAPDPDRAAARLARVLAATRADLGPSRGTR